MNKAIKCGALTLLSVVLACDYNSLELDKVQGPTIENTFAFNLGSITYTVGELVEDIEDESLEIKEGEDFFLSFVYRDTTIFDNIDEFVVVEDISNLDQYSPFPSDIPSLPTENVVAAPTKDFEFEFNPEGGEQIDSVFFKGGNMVYTIQSDFDAQIDYTLILHDLQDENGDPLTFVRTIPQGTSSDSQTTPMDGFKNVSRRVDEVNIYDVTMDMTFTIPPNTPISATDQISFEMQFLDSEFSAVFGAFGMDSVSVANDTIRIEAFEEFNEGGLSLRNPSITNEYINKFGIEFGMVFDSLIAIDFDDTEVFLSGDASDNPQFVDAPNGSQLGEAVNSTVVIDETNSNLDELLNTTPEQMVFVISAIPNVAGSDNLNNFLLDTSYLEVRSTIEIPFDFNMDGFSRDFDSEVSGSDLEDADSLVLEIQTLNDIPFSGVVDIAFNNADGEQLYQLTGISIIESPAPGSDGRTTQKVESSSTINLDREGIDAFLQTTDIVTTINVFTFGSESGEFVKIFSDYELEIYLKAAGKVSVDL